MPLIVQSEAEARAPASVEREVSEASNPRLVAVVHDETGKEVGRSEARGEADVTRSNVTVALPPIVLTKARHMVHMVHRTVHHAVQWCITRCTTVHHSVTTRSITLCVTWCVA